MGNLKYFLNHRCIHASLSHVSLCLSLSILLFIYTLGINCALYSGKRSKHTKLHFAVSSLGALYMHTYFSGRLINLSSLFLCLILVESISHKFWLLDTVDLLESDW